MFVRGSYCIACAPETRHQEVERRGDDPTAYYRLRRFGIDGSTFRRMLEVQGGRCAICRTDKPGHQRQWALDHDHDTGQARGVLCHLCNRALGMLGDDPDNVDAAGGYLRAGGHPVSGPIAVEAQGDPSRFTGYRR